MYRLGEETYKRKKKIIYIPLVFFPTFSLSTFRGLPTLNETLNSYLYQLNPQKYVSKPNPAKIRKK